MLGVSGQPVRVTRFGGVSFLRVKAAEWVTRLTEVIQALERDKLHRLFHLQNRQNTDEIDSAGDNLGVELDSQANQLNQTKVLPATTIDIEATSSFIKTNERA